MYNMVKISFFKCEGHAKENFFTSNFAYFQHIPALLTFQEIVEFIT